MHCRTCDYTLWNLETRHCPECGAGFRPSDYQFALNSVRFLCPGCRTAYYGQSDEGHLVPSEFDCVTCARHLRMDEMILLPAAGVTDETTKGDSMPWLERRDGRGLIKAWLATFGRVFSHPTSLIALVPGDRPASESLLFGLSVLTPCFLVNGSVFAVSGFTSVFLGSGGGSLNALLAIVLSVVGLAVLVCLVLLAQACVAHLTIMVTGGTDRSFRRTLECLCYASPTACFAALPCLGFLLAPLLLTWWYITSAQMLGEVHKASMRRTAAGVLLIPGAIVLLVAGSIIVKVWNLPPGGGSIRISSGVASSPEQRFADALLNHRSLHGAYPTHPLELAADFPSNIPLLSPHTSLDAAKVGDTTLAALGDPMFPGEIAALIRTLPASETPAVGDVTLLCPGLAAPTTPSELWVACIKGAIITNQLGMSRGPSMVVLGDGTLRPLPAESSETFALQQALRASLGLKPLPPVAGW